MSKYLEIKLDGQPILNQLLKLVDKLTFKELIAEKKSDHYYKTFKNQPHFVTIMYDIYNCCDLKAETCKGLSGISGKLNHVNLQKYPAKRCEEDGLRNGNIEFLTRYIIN